MRRHPARSLEMAVMHRTRAFFFDPSIQAEDDLGHLAPVGTLVIGVKYP